MANPRTRKRVHGFQRAPDGSAFQKCDSCGVSVAIALLDMHECRLKGKKRLKGESGNQKIQRLSFNDQPRSPFCNFMKNFKRAKKNEDWIDVDRKGFETWKNMSIGERHKFVLQAEKVNLAYEKAILEEVDDTPVVDDDEADSAMAGKFDLFEVLQDYESYEDWDNSDDWEFSESFKSPHYKRIESFDTFEWDMVRPWVTSSGTEDQD